MWLNGRKDGIDWCDVLVKDGVAFGEVSRNQAAERRAEQAALGAGAARDAPVGDYDDPTAVLTGQWGADQYGKARVFSRNQTDEVLPGGADPSAAQHVGRTSATAMRCSFAA